MLPWLRSAVRRGGNVERMRLFAKKNRSWSLGSTREGRWMYEEVIVMLAHPRRR